MLFVKKKKNNPTLHTVLIASISLSFNTVIVAILRLYCSDLEIPNYVCDKSYYYYLLYYNFVFL